MLNDIHIVNDLLQNLPVDLSSEATQRTGLRGSRSYGNSGRRLVRLEGHSYSERISRSSNEANLSSADFRKSLLRFEYLTFGLLCARALEIGRSIW